MVKIVKNVKELTIPPLILLVKFGVGCFDISTHLLNINY